MYKYMYVLSVLRHANNIDNSPNLWSKMIKMHIGIYHVTETDYRISLNDIKASVWKKN